MDEIPLPTPPPPPPTKKKKKSCWHASLGNQHFQTPGPEIIKLFSCSTQLSMMFFHAYKC